MIEFQLFKKKFGNRLTFEIQDSMKIALIDIQTLCAVGRIHKKKNPFSVILAFRHWLEDFLALDLNKQFPIESLFLSIRLLWIKIQKARKSFDRDFVNLDISLNK